MRVVVQRCKNADIKVNGEQIAKIGIGFLLFVGFTDGDDVSIVKKVAKKVMTLRIFEDENDKMNLDINDVQGSVLSVSQFTLYAKLDGRRPSFSKAMNYDEANKLYNLFNKELETYNVPVATGVFGADMKVSLLNDGPVTIIIDSEHLV